MCDFVKIETGHDGRTVMIEPAQRHGLDRRVFRQCGEGYEWTHLHDYREYGSRARRYGYAGKELPPTFSC